MGGIPRRARRVRQRPPNQSVRNAGEQRPAVVDRVTSPDRASKPGEISAQRISRLTASDTTAIYHHTAIVAHNSAIATRVLKVAGEAGAGIEG